MKSQHNIFIPFIYKFICHSMGKRYLGVIVYTEDLQHLIVTQISLSIPFPCILGSVEKVVLAYYLSLLPI